MIWGRNDLISKDKIQAIIENSDWMSKEQIIEALQSLTPEWSNFNLGVLLNEAYNDGYEAGYVQGNYDWRKSQ